MAFNKDNSGSLSKNERKEKETHPDVKGKATIGGVEYWISGWKKKNEKGIWFSLSFEPKDGDSSTGRIPSKPDGDIPW